MENYNYSNVELQQIATTALNQIRASIKNNVWFSWGVGKVFATLFNGRPALSLLVSARLLKGFVFVVLDEGRDLYDIYKCDVKMNDNGDDVKTVAEDVYCDQLGEIIDREIESGDDAEEYEKFCENEQKKLQGIFN